MIAVNYSHMFHLQSQRRTFPEGRGSTAVRVSRCPVVISAVPLDLCCSGSGHGAGRRGCLQVRGRLYRQLRSDCWRKTLACISMLHDNHAKGLRKNSVLYTYFNQNQFCLNRVVLESYREKSHLCRGCNV